MAEPVRARRLTDEEGRRLQQIVRRGKHGSIRVRRAMIIMASASGTLVPAIARLVAADEDTVRDVIHAFNQKGLAALDPRWAGGRPRLISDGDIDVIVVAATTRPEKLGQPFTHWSMRKLAGYQRAAPSRCGSAGSGCGSCCTPAGFRSSGPGPGLGHGGDDSGVELAGGLGSGGGDLDAARCLAGEYGAGHLGPASVVRADEQHAGDVVRG